MMKDDYKHDQMMNTIVIRVFPDMRKDLEELFKQSGDRFESMSHMLRSMVRHSQYCQKFTELII